MLSLRSRLIAMFIAVAALPLAVYSGWTQSRALEQQVRDVEGKHLLIARNLGSALERYHNDIVSTFEYFAHSLADGKVVENADELLVDLKFRHVCVAEISSGKVVNGMLRDRVSCPVIVPAKRFAVFNKLAVVGQTVMTGVLPSPTGDPTIYFVRKENDKLIIGAIETDYFVELGKQISFGVRGHAAIVDQFGRVLDHPLPHWAAQMKDISKVSAVQRMLRGESGVQTFYSPALKDDMIAGFTSVKGAGWGVMIPQPMIELREAATEIWKLSLTLFAAGVAFAFVVSLLLANAITAPCRTMTDRARSARNGDVRPPTRQLSGVFAPIEFKALSSEIDQLGEKIGRLQADKDAAEGKLVHERREAEQRTQEFARQISERVDLIDGLSVLLTDQDRRKTNASGYRAYASKIIECTNALAATVKTMSDTHRLSHDAPSKDDDEAQPAVARA